MHSPLIFAGNANRPLAEEIARHLGVSVGRALVSTFKDGETWVYRMAGNYPDDRLVECLSQSLQAGRDFCQRWFAYCPAEHRARR